MSIKLRPAPILKMLAVTLRARHEILLKNKQELTLKLGEELLDDAYIHYYIRKKYARAVV